MKTTKIVIKNLFGIKETELDGRSVEISGPKGSGKTSVLDSIRYALTNRSDRDYIVHRGADEGEILIETDTGLSIDRREIWNEPIWAQRRIRKVNDSRLLRALQDAAAQRATSVLNLLSKLITYARKKILKGVDSYYEWKKLH